MKNSRLILFFTLIPLHLLSAQPLTGFVTDENNIPLNGASILLNDGQLGTATNKNGYFNFQDLPNNFYTIAVSFLGYKTYKDTLNLIKRKDYRIKLQSTDIVLDDIIVKEQWLQTLQKGTSLSLAIIDKDFLTNNISGSLMQTLNRLPGINSMDIGSGQSKPTIRGLGFNRIIVAENGIKHEAQEWGVDHGLEIDQFSVERIEIYKGPASLMYGANAIGGVIDLKQISTPEKHTQGGNILISTQTNNNLYALSAKYYKRVDHFYVKTHVSLSQYGDYRVPTDSIEYMSYFFKLKKHRLRNTAGNEESIGVTIGYLIDQFSSHLSISDIRSQSGFFANAHGLEIRNSLIDYDYSTRDIDLPYQQVNHFKILSNNIWFLANYKFNIDLAYQNNHRQEFSEAVSHGYMPMPPDSLERLYHKNTWTANIRLTLPQFERQEFITGLNTEFQDNNIGGWGFMIPAHKTFIGGVFVHDKISINPKWVINAGIRYDIGIIHTEAYHDWYLTPLDNGISEYKERGTKLQRVFNNVTWGIGAIYSYNEFTTKINVGKGFRIPTAKELAANGINYHMYRYEKGDTTLHAEQSYQLDIELIWKPNKWQINISPFVNYFPNYIYLNPTSDYYEAQQVYYHSESEVFRAGLEGSISYQFTPELTSTADVEYLYSTQLSGSKKGYTLPFSPPLTSHIELRYCPKFKKILSNPSLGIDLKLVATQKNIVPPEKKTAGYILLNLNASTEFVIGKQILQVNIQLNNALNTCYYDHTSFYRLLEVPGSGRNFIITLQVPLRN